MARRAHEMGVRLALGAAPAQVSWIVLRESLHMVLIGLVVGAVLWFPVLTLTRRLVYGISPHDPVALGGGALVLLLSGVIAAAVPAVRAARTDPLKVLRAE